MYIKIGRIVVKSILTCSHISRQDTTIDAIRAATINPVEMLNLHDRGEIKEGLLADIIAVDSNPLNDIKILENVKFVMKGGLVYKNEG